MHPDPASCALSEDESEPALGDGRRSRACRVPGSRSAGGLVGL
jgi:hypothetical protein